VVAVVAVPMQLGSGLPKQLIQRVVGCPHTRECMGNSTKQYAGPASADSIVLLGQLFPFASES
jgi:phage protein U